MRSSIEMAWNKFQNLVRQVRTQQISIYIARLKNLINRFRLIIARPIARNAKCLWCALHCGVACRCTSARCCATKADNKSLGRVVWTVCDARSAVICCEEETAYLWIQINSGLEVDSYIIKFQSAHVYCASCA